MRFSAKPPGPVAGEVEDRRGGARGSGLGARGAGLGPAMGAPGGGDTRGAGGVYAEAHQVGLALAAEGRVADAEVALRGAWEWRGKALGPDHEDTLASQAALAGVLRRAGRPVEAEPLARGCLEAHTRSVGAAHPRTHLSALALAGVVKDVGDASRRDEVDGLYAGACEGIAAALGEAHPAALAALNNHAVFLKGCNRLVEAEALYRRVLPLSEKAIGADHLHTLASASNLAIVLDLRAAEARGREGGGAGGAGGRGEDPRAREAEDLFRRVLGGYRAALGDGHPETVATASYLADACREGGRSAGREALLDEAEALYKEVAKTRRTTLGEDDPLTLMSLNNLGVFLKHRNPEQSVQVLEEALAGARRAFGDKHPDTVSTANNLALVLGANGANKQAAALLRKAMSDWKDAFGTEHPGTLEALHSLGQRLADEKKFGEAEPVLADALAGRKDALGCTHPDTLDTMQLYAQVLYGAGRKEDSQAMQAELDRCALEHQRDKAAGCA